jgi:hypothetical protein
LEARRILGIAGEFIPQDSKVRELLAPPRVRRSSERGVDRSPEFRWLKANAEAYRGKWVALAEERLIACADSLRDLLSQLASISTERKPLIHRIE